MNIPSHARLRTPRIAGLVMLVGLLVPATVAGCRGGTAPTVAPECVAAGAARCKPLDSYESACDGLRRADCVEGFPTAGINGTSSTCEEVLRLNDTGVWPKVCWATAKSKPDVLKCGQTRCLARRP